MLTKALARSTRRARAAVKDPVIGRASNGGRGVAGPYRQGHDLAAMAGSSTVFGVVDQIARMVAAVDWHLYLDYEPGTPVEQRTEVHSHPALLVWDEPNPFYSQRLFIETLQQHYELTGERWWINASPSGGTVPVWIWPARPDTMKPVPDPYRFIAGYTKRVGNVEIPLAPQDVIYQRRPNPDDPYRGIGPLGSLSPDLAAEINAARWNAVFFENSARPDGVISTPEVMTDTEFKRYQAHREEDHRGVSNAHRVMLMEGGTFSPAGYSQKDMDFVSLRGFTKAQVREAWQFPEILLGKSEGVNRATAWAQLAMFTKTVIVPRLDQWRESLNRDWLPLFGQPGRGVRFDYGDPMPPDPEDDRADLKSRTDAAKALVDMGADPAEACEAYGLPPVTFREPPPRVASPPDGPPQPNPDDTEQGDNRP